MKHFGAVKTFDVDGRTLRYEEIAGEGPTIVCVPGLGDTRAQFRLLAPALAAQGYHVIALDPRGQGASDTGFASYGAHDVGADVLALTKHLGLSDVALIGNSAGAAAAVWAAAEMPEAVSKIVLIGPFVRDVPPSFWQNLMLRAGFAGPWAPWMWGKYYRSLYPSKPPADLDAYVEALTENLKEPGRLDALRAMLFTPKSEAARRIPDVKAKVLVVMGEKDPDFKNPSEEAALVAGLLRGRAVMIAGAGHYPHVEFVDETLASIREFLHESN